MSWFWSHKAIVFLGYGNDAVAFRTTKLQIKMKDVTDYIIFFKK